MIDEERFLRRILVDEKVGCGGGKRRNKGAGGADYKNERHQKRRIPFFRIPGGHSGQDGRLLGVGGFADPVLFVGTVRAGGVESEGRQFRQVAEKGCHEIPRILHLVVSGKKGGISHDRIVEKSLVGFRGL